MFDEVSLSNHETVCVNIFVVIIFTLSKRRTPHYSFQNDLSKMFTFKQNSQTTFEIIIFTIYSNDSQKF